MPLTEEEREALAADFREELVAEHERRLQKHEEQQRRREDRRARGDSTDRQVALSELKDSVRADFYKEHGYRRYVDSTGRENWLTPEEYAVRTARRKARRSRMPAVQGSDGPSYVAYVVVAVLAVLLGMLLAR